MEDLEQRVRRIYLQRMDDYSWCEDFPANEGAGALPIFVHQFQIEKDPKRRARLISVIWRFRTAAALATLAIALREDVDEVWKEALDGFVAIGGESSIRFLREFRETTGVSANDIEKRAWIDEAIEQIREVIQTGRPI